MPHTLPARCTMNTLNSQQPEPPEPDSIRAQLQGLDERVRIHMRTFWQMPAAYLAIVGMAVGRADSGPKTQVALILALAGLCIIWAMVHSVQAAHRAADQFIEAETQLRLQPTVMRRFWIHALPHFFLVILGIAACAMLVYR
jgi:hypothetical protein